MLRLDIQGEWHDGTLFSCCISYISFSFSFPGLYAVFYETRWLNERASGAVTATGLWIFELNVMRAPFGFLFSFSGLFADVCHKGGWLDTFHDTPPVDMCWARLALWAFSQLREFNASTTTQILWVGGYLGRELEAGGVCAYPTTAICTGLIMLRNPGGRLCDPSYAERRGAPQASRLGTPGTTSRLDATSGLEQPDRVPGDLADRPNKDFRIYLTLLPPLSPHPSTLLYADLMSVDLP
ncbi:hypothetical protein BU17DRAFT_72801 [Hysterangium stoloniferum]|nr:hypothetical protein BU17DRAFT_72801 [Hysterangium stoloniferum]